MSIAVTLCPVGGPALRARRWPPEPMTMLTTAWVVAAIGFAAVVACCLELRRRRELVARACHELRGPLTAVRLSLATMERRGEAPPERLASSAPRPRGGGRGP